MTSAPECYCLRRIHMPRPADYDMHHVIPRAWQRAWTPPEVTPDSEGLWAQQTIPLAPTCHRNVHFRLAAFMHAGVEPGNRKGRDPYEGIALDGMRAWVAHGGSLQFLRDHRLWGVA